MLATVKVAIVGDYAVGKSCLLQSYIHNNVDMTNVKTTLGVDFYSKTLHVNNRNVRLRIWDTAGSERYRSLMCSYLRDASIVILVYDVSKTYSMESVEEWMKTIQAYMPRVVAVVGNKTDIGSLAHDIHTCIEPWKHYDWHIFTSLTSARKPDTFKDVMKKSLDLALNATIKEKKPSLVFQNEKTSLKRTCCA